MKHKFHLLSAAILAATTNISLATVFNIGANPNWAVPVNTSGLTMSPIGSQFIMFTPKQSGTASVLANPDSASVLNVGNLFGTSTEDITGTFNDKLLCTSNDSACTDFALTVVAGVGFSGTEWIAHSIRVFPPGTYTLNLGCNTNASLSNGNTGICEDTSTQTSFTVPFGKLGAHILFNYGPTLNIDVPLVFDLQANFTLDHGQFAIAISPDTRQFTFAANTDIDGDGRPGFAMVDGPFPNHNAVFNLFLEGNPNLDFTPPVIDVTNGNITIEQRTGGCVGNTAYADPGVSANDPSGSTGAVGEPYGGDGSTPVVTSGDTIVDTAAPGTSFTVNYSATDAAGNVSTASRTVDVVDCGIDVDPPTITNSPSNASLLLGSSITAPAAADITANDATGVGTITIAITNSNGATVNTIDTSVEDTYTVTYTVPDTSDAANTATASHTISIRGLNLVATQAGSTTRTIVANDGNVTFSSAFTAGHTYDWSATDDNIDSGSGNTGDSFTVDPSGVSAGTYLVSMTMDGNTTATVAVTVTNTAPTLTTADSDGDGINDVIEGFGDDDNDGIPNFLDNSTVASNVLQLDATDSTSSTATVNAGSLRLGTTAQGSASNGAAVTLANIISNGNGAGGVPTDAADAGVTDSCIGGCFDFEVSGLVPGSTVNVVLPLSTSIPSQNPATYRKFNGTAWADFDTSANNAIASAAAVGANCPAPGDVAYTDGLTAGNTCIQLSITDGGPNDADGSTNGIVKDPGGIGGTQDIVVVVVVAEPSVPDLGSTGLYMLAMLSGLLGLRRFKK